MKNQNRIERKNKTVSTAKQSKRPVPDISRLDILISDECSARLGRFADRLNRDRKQIAKDAIGIYFEFMDKYPDLAEVQPPLQFGTSLLWLGDDQPFPDRFQNAQFVFGFDPNSIAEQALCVYLDYAAKRSEYWLMDVENIRFQLNQPTRAARLALMNMIRPILAQPVEDAIADLHGVSDLIRPNLGLLQENRAIMMMIQAFDHLEASDSKLEWRRVHNENSTRPAGK